MPFASAMTTASDAARAIDDVCSKALAELGEPPQLALFFFSSHFSDEAAFLASELRQRVASLAMLGCSAEAIVGNEQEIEDRPALCLWLGTWRRPMKITPFHLQWQPTPDGHCLMGQPDALDDADPSQAVVILLGDPFTFPADVFLKQVNESHKGIRVVGGMASGGRMPGECLVVKNGDVLAGGAVGVLLEGVSGIRTIVSQGCRPIGRHFVVTKARDNIILELGGKPPLLQLQQMWQELDANDQHLLQQGLHLGYVINEYQDKFRRGDFLVRNVLGLERETGAMAVTDRVRVGQTVQFHVRDADTADEDLRMLLRQDREQHPRAPDGGLLFTCNGRGTRLFSAPHHDAQAIRQEIGAIPLAGFFAQGELGPVGGQNFIHGFTASVVLFDEE
ncbi:MAG: hypothetical protein KatS3mg105_2361 [Gemmatales bacterium]|nr:MAG: hypothetical protein KatS3mg105_2361 [Gemmatales bacterium]